MGYFTETYTETLSVTTTTRLPKALEGFIVAAEILLLAYPWNLTVKVACLAQKLFSVSFLGETYGASDRWLNYGAEDCSDIKVPKLLWPGMSGPFWSQGVW